MSTIYRFEVAPCGAVLEVEHNLVLADTWEDVAQSPHVAWVKGNVDSSQDDRLVCHTGPPDSEPVTTLQGATWEAKVGDDGEATCHANLCDPPEQQTWKLVGKK